ncbi:MAG: hypothetical protein ABI579_05120 [Candidatus Sumerlaeota bacterium]
MLSLRGFAELFAMQQPSAFKFSIAGVGFSVEGDDAILAAIAQLFDEFPTPQGPPDWTLLWEGARCHYDQRSVPLVIPDQRFAPSSTTILIGFLLRRTMPNAVFLHGNALVDGNDRVMILLGDSGAGKTTLSQEFLTRESWELLAEDFLIIDPATRVLHSYPRAASIRSEHQSNIKTRRAPHKFTTRSRSLENSFIIILDRGLKEQLAAAQPQISLWLSSIPANIDAIMSDADVAFYDVRQTEPFPCITLNADALPRLRKMGEAFLRAGALPLGTTAPDTWTTARQPAFPNQPGGHCIPTPDALNRIISNQVIFGIGEELPARNFMNLAKVFSDSSCAIVSPGGSPVGTADFIDALRGA